MCVSRSTDRQTGRQTDCQPVAHRPYMYCSREERGQPSHPSGGPLGILAGINWLLWWTHRPGQPDSGLPDSLQPSPTRLAVSSLLYYHNTVWVIAHNKMEHSFILTPTSYIFFVIVHNNKYRFLVRCFLQQPLPVLITSYKYDGTRWFKLRHPHFW